MKGFYAGSFDPFTNGHLAIVKKASNCFERVVVGIGYNTEKSARINKEQMRDAIVETIRRENLENVDVVLYYGLTTEEAKKHGCDILIRGLRNGTDYQYEENIAAINEHVEDLDTCYFRAGDLGFLSSSLVFELYQFGKDVSAYLPEPVNNLLNSLRENN